jgi:hypothetical protein
LGSEIEVKLNLDKAEGKVLSIRYGYDFYHAHVVLSKSNTNKKIKQIAIVPDQILGDKMVRQHRILLRKMYAGLTLNVAATFTP